MEAEPGIGEYEPPPPAPMVVPEQPPVDSGYVSGHQSRYEHHEEHSVPVAPVGYSEYRRRYEHQRTQSRVVSGDPTMVNF